MNDGPAQHTPFTRRDISICSYKYRIRELLLILCLCYCVEIIIFKFGIIYTCLGKATVITLLSKMYMKKQEENILRFYILVHSMQVNGSMIIGYPKYRPYILLHCFVIYF
jgi:hypothetical protein